VFLKLKKVSVQNTIGIINLAYNINKLNFYYLHNLEFNHPIFNIVMYALFLSTQTQQYF
jgi:hypothetical protein